MMCAVDDTRGRTHGDRDLVLRDAGAVDAPAVAAILVHALSAKYRPAFGRRAEAAIAGAVRDNALHPAPGGFVVAERHGEPVGVIHLATQEHDTRRGDDDWRRLVERVGRIGAARGWFVLRPLRRAPLDADELHISELAVAERARRSGVASALLEEATRRALAGGKTRLSLWVTVDNLPALRLYARAGFSVRRFRRFYLGRLLFGSNGLQLMSAPLRSDAPTSED